MTIQSAFLNYDRLAILGTLGIPEHTWVHSLKTMDWLWTLAVYLKDTKWKQSNLPFLRYCKFAWNCYYSSMILSFHSSIVSYIFIVSWYLLHKTPDYTQLNQEYYAELRRSVYIQKKQNNPACLSYDISKLLFWVLWAYPNKLT